MNGKLENNGFFAQIGMKCREDADNFIFETVRPFCEKVTGQKISKHMLEAALRQYLRGNRWIPVTERMPHTEACGYINEKGECVIDVIAIVAPSQSARMVTYDGKDFRYGGEIYDATHWMPKPSPPVGEG